MSSKKKIGDIVCPLLRLYFQFTLIYLSSKIKKILQPTRRHRSYVALAVKEYFEPEPQNNFIRTSECAMRVKKAKDCLYSYMTRYYELVVFTTCVGIYFPISSKIECGVCP